MAKLADYSAGKLTKMLLVGNNGSGKTGALASLAAAGYNLRIIDLDKGAKILAGLLLDKQSKYGPEAASRVEIESISDSMKTSGNGRLIPRKAEAWQRLVRLLENWKTETADFGPITSWTAKDILIIDSLTMAAKAAMNFVLSLNARLGQKPHQSDWYEGQQLLETMMQMLFDDAVGCHIIINCHIMYIGADNGPQMAYPETLGKALSPKIGSYFNTILLAKSSGIGANASRKIYTKAGGLLELKTASPLKVKSEYPIDTGLADFFRDERTGEPPV